jgi:Fe-S cluster assembly protein SufD
MRTELLELNNSKEIHVTEDTQFVMVGGENISLNLIFEKPGVSAEVLGIFDLPNGAEIKLETCSKHIATNTSCTTYIKAVLDDKSSFDYRGKIIIEKKAQQTTAYLHDDALVVGKNTKRNSQPTLEIDANDVKASHGSTTGRIDKDQLYYLESRGLSEPEAKDLIKEGFLSALVDRILDKDIREKVLNKLKSKEETI